MLMTPLSTATSERLPDIETLRRITKSIAMLDAIICPDWQYRYYSFNSKWGPGEEMASMHNGCGDEWFLLFDSNGAALKGLAHEFPLARDSSFATRIQETVPQEFAAFLNEPAFAMEAASFCIWRRRADARWSVVLPAIGRVSPEEDGSAELIAVFDGNPDTYRSWAQDYYEREIDPQSVRAIYDQQPLSDALVSSLNPDLTLEDVEKDAMEISYPHGNHTGSSDEKN